MVPGLSRTNFWKTRTVIPEAAEQLSGTFDARALSRSRIALPRVSDDARLWNLFGPRAFLKTPPENSGIDREDTR
jgi:hypothetical protein